MPSVSSIVTSKVRLRAQSLPLAVRWASSAADVMLPEQAASRCSCFERVISRATRIASSSAST